MVVAGYGREWKRRSFQYGSPDQCQAGYRPPGNVRLQLFKVGIVAVRPDAEQLRTGVLEEIDDARWSPVAFEMPISVDEQSTPTFCENLPLDDFGREGVAIPEVTDLLGGWYVVDRPDRRVDLPAGHASFVLWAATCLRRAQHDKTPQK